MSRTRHYGYEEEHLVVFRETFTGDGAATTFQLTGNIGNATFETGAWDVNNVEISMTADTTKTTRGALYDSTNVLTRHKISVISISATGLVTLDYPPMAENFYVWYWYDLEGDALQDYYREDYVNSMEADAGVTIASGITTNTTGFNGILSAADDTVQKALDTIDNLSLTPSGLTFSNTNRVLGRGTAGGGAGEELVLSSDYGVAFTYAASSLKINTSQDLRSNASPTFANLYLGVDDTTYGTLSLYGDGTGSHLGGILNLYVAADYDTTITNWQIYPYDDILYISNNAGDVAAFTTFGDLKILGGTVICTDLTDGYIPYHVSDSAGLANSPIRTDGSVVALGMSPTALRLLGLTYSAVNTSLVYGISLDINEDYSVTDTYYNRGMYLSYYINPNGNQTAANSGYDIALETQILVRENAGILNIVRGQLITVGSYGPGGADVSCTISNLYGLSISGLKMTSTTVTSAFGIYISGMSGSTLWDLYCADADACNYLAGTLGIAINVPAGRLEVEDNATTASMLVKITQDDANVYGLVIGNDTYSTTDTNGLQFKVSDTGVGTIDCTVQTQINSAGANLIGTKVDATNIVIGYQAGKVLTTGASGNIVVGYNSMPAQTTGDRNIVLGYEAAYSMSTASCNIAIGYRAAYRTEGGYNVAIGDAVLLGTAGQTGGSENVAIGYQAAIACYGTRNVALGSGSGGGLKAGTANMVIGSSTMIYTDGSYNTAVGVSALEGANLGDLPVGNVSIGHQSGYRAKAAQYNVLIGYQAGVGVNAGYGNVAVGCGALYGSTTTSTYDRCVAIGFEAGYALTTGDYNIFIGYRAGDNVTSGGTCIIIGSDLNAGSATGNYQLNIGGLLFGNLDAKVLGIGVDVGVSANAKVEIEDGATSQSILLKITQDDANVYALAIGNDTYSTTDTTALLFKLGDSGISYILPPTKDIYIGSGAAGIDYTLTFVGESNSGVLAWMEDENWFQLNRPIRMATSLYRRYYHIALDSANPGASGATWVNPGANSTGGWQLNAASEVLHGQADIHADWDGATDLKVEVRFYVNVDNSGGGAGDTVDLKLVCYYKGVGDTVTKTQTVEVATTVGASAQYKAFKADFTINWDEASNVVEAGDVIGFLLNLETDTSEVDDVVVTEISFSYLTTHTGIENGDE